MVAVCYTWGMRKILGVAVAVVLAGVLVGCSNGSPSTPGQPYPVETAGVDMFHVQMDNELIVTCLEGGALESHTLTCFKGGQDYEDSIPVSETSYDVSYLDVGQGVVVACFEEGFVKTKVFTCFPYEG